MVLLIGTRGFPGGGLSTQKKGAGMRLFHVSEESGIKVFEPRIPLRKDLDQTVGLVWAIDERTGRDSLHPRGFPMW